MSGFRPDRASSLLESRSEFLGGDEGGDRTEHGAYLGSELIHKYWHSKEGSADGLDELLRRRRLTAALGPVINEKDPVSRRQVACIRSMCRRPR